MPPNSDTNHNPPWVSAVPTPTPHPSTSLRNRQYKIRGVISAEVAEGPEGWDYAVHRIHADPDDPFYTTHLEILTYGFGYLTEHQAKVEAEVAMRQIIDGTSTATERG